MKISSFDKNSKNVSFSAISLSTKETTKSLQLLLKYRTADISARPKLANDLFMIFDNKLKNESFLISKKWRSREDVLQDLYLEFLESIAESMQVKNPLEYVIQKLNHFKPKNTSYTTEFGDCSIDKNISNLKFGHYTYADLATKNFSDQTSSHKEKEKFIRRLYREKEDFDKILTEKEQIVCNKFLEGLNYKKIADSLKITETRVRHHMSVIIAKIRALRNVSEPNTEMIIRELKGHFSLKVNTNVENLFIQNPSLSNIRLEEIIKRMDYILKTLDVTAEEVIKLLNSYPNLLSLKSETIQNNIEKSSKLLNIDEKLFIKMAKTSGHLLYAKPETLKNNVEKTAKTLNTTHDTVIKLAESSPSLLTAKDTTLLSNIKKLAQELGISQNECLALYQKTKFLLSRNADNLIKNMKRTASLLNMDYETYKKLAKKQTQLIYQKPETINNNMIQLSKLTLVPKDILVNGFVSKPQLFIQKPETIYAHVTELSKFFGVSVKDCMEICLRAPQLITQKPETIIANAQKYSDLLKKPIEEVIKIAKKQPGIFVRNPQVVVKNNNILDFYSLIRGKEKTAESFRMNTSDELYASILRYLIKSSGANDFPSSRKILETTKDYILNHPENEYSFELPPHGEFDNFVEFSQKLSEELLGRNVFKFVQKELQKS